VRVVSVTEALNASRVRRWAGNPADWARRAQIGTAVHRALAILDCNGVSWEGAIPDWIAEFDAVSPEVKPMCLAWECFKAEHHFKPRLIEHTFFAKDGITEFVTTIDREGLMDGLPSIVEIKTPKIWEPYWGVQLAGQEIAVLSVQGPPRERPYRYQRVAVQVRADRSYRLRVFDKPSDYAIFRCSLTIAVWNRNEYGE